MLSKIGFSSLTSIIAMSIVALSSAAEQDAKPGSTAEVHTLQLGSIELKAEEIDYKIQRDGKHLIKLQGQAGIQIDEMTFSADSIEATYTKKKEDVVLKLTDNVEIISKADQFRAKALSADVDFKKKSLTLKSGEGKSVTLIQTNGSKTTEIEASQLQLSFQDSDSVFMKTLGSLKLNEKKVKLNTKPVKRRSNNFDQFSPAGNTFEVQPKKTSF